MTDWTAIPGVTWTWEIATGFARINCKICGMTARSMDYDRLHAKGVEHSTTHLYMVNQDVGPQAGNPNLTVLHKITYHMQHFADPAYTFSGGRVYCQCGWNTSGTDERALRRQAEDHMADQFMHADGTPWFTPPEGMRVRHAGHVPNHWFTASCTRCGWDVDSRNHPDWDTQTANHLCQTSAPAVKRAGLHHIMEMTRVGGGAAPQWQTQCTRCNWNQLGDQATALAELANIHAASHTDEITPAVGMTIHYQSFGTPSGEYPSTCRAGIITDASDEDGTSIAVFNPDGIFLKSGILHDESRSGGTWHWPHD